MSDRPAALQYPRAPLPRYTIGDEVTTADYRACSRSGKPIFVIGMGSEVGWSDTDGPGIIIAPTWKYELGRIEPDPEFGGVKIWVWGTQDEADIEAVGGDANSTTTATKAAAEQGPGGP
jgi:hypothetical protein